MFHLSGSSPLPSYQCGSVLQNRRPATFLAFSLCSMVRSCIFPVPTCNTMKASPMPRQTFDILLRSVPTSSSARCTCCLEVVSGAGGADGFSRSAPRSQPRYKRSLLTRKPCWCASRWRHALKFCVGTCTSWTASPACIRYSIRH